MKVIAHLYSLQNICRIFKKGVDKYKYLLYYVQVGCRTDEYARVAQLVEHDLAKVGAAGSSPVSRSKNYNCYY